MKTKKTKIIIVVAVLMVLILSAMYLRPIKTVNKRFDVNYISPDERVDEISLTLYIPCDKILQLKPLEVFFYCVKI